MPVRQLPPLPPPSVTADPRAFYHWLLQLQLVSASTEEAVAALEATPAVSAHNDLTGIQGGDANDYHHWTAQEKLDETVRHWLIVEG